MSDPVRARRRPADRRSAPRCARSRPHGWTRSSRPAPAGPPSPPRCWSLAGSAAYVGRPWPPSCRRTGLVLLDVGAGMQVSRPTWRSTPRWAAGYARLAAGVAQPRVGLLSVGAEPGKGDRLRRAADAVLRLHPLPGASYVGPVEGHDVITGARADVVVTDGFTGNVLLKGIEAVAGRGCPTVRPSPCRGPRRCSASPARSWSVTVPRTATTSRLAWPSRPAWYAVRPWYGRPWLGAIPRRTGRAGSRPSRPRGPRTGSGEQDPVDDRQTEPLAEVHA